MQQQHHHHSHHQYRRRHGTSVGSRIQTWNNGTPITAAIASGVTVNGYGLELQQTGGTSGTINLINNSGGAIDSDTGSATPALALIGNSGNISYSGAGSIFGTDQVGIYATNTGTGQISIVTSGTISAGNGAGGDDYGIQTSAINGATTIDLTGGTIEGASTGGLSHGAGIYARSVGANVTITTNNIGLSAADRTNTGIDAAITGNASGQLKITSLGTVYATQAGISAVNNNLGGIIVNLNAGSTLNVTGGVATVGEFVRDTGAAGGITVTNQAGSTIDPDLGVDSQITNNANSGNVTVHQDGAITAADTGIIAATNGTGSVLVDGAGNVVGGNGVFSLSTATPPVTADNAGIVAVQAGTAGGVTVSGTGKTSGTGAITAEITDSSNSSAVLVNRSGAISVTGTTGFGINANTLGTGTVTVQNTGTIAGSGGGTVAAGITATGSGGNVLVQNVSGITAGATDGYGIAASTIGNGTVTVDGTGAITAAGNGVSATTTGSGKVSVTGTGAIIADFRFKHGGHRHHRHLGRRRDHRHAGQHGFRRQRHRRRNNFKRRRHGHDQCRQCHRHGRLRPEDGGGRRRDHHHHQCEQRDGQHLWCGVHFDKRQDHRHRLGPFRRRKPSRHQRHDDGRHRHRRGL